MTRLWADMDVCDTIYNECRRGTEPGPKSSVGALFAVTPRSLPRAPDGAWRPSAARRTTTRRHDESPRDLFYGFGTLSVPRFARLPAAGRRTDNSLSR